MTMTGAGLYSAVAAALGTAQDAAMQQAALKPICDAIVAYIKSNATVTVTVTSVSGVTTGTGVSGPGTGTAVIT